MYRAGGGNGRGTDDLQHLLCIYGAEDPGIWKIKGYGRYKAADPADCIPGGTFGHCHSPAAGTSGGKPDRRACHRVDLPPGREY